MPLTADEVAERQRDLAATHKVAAILRPPAGCANWRELAHRKEWTSELRSPELGAAINTAWRREKTRKKRYGVE